MKKEMKKGSSNLKDYIKLYENVLDKEICKNIIKDADFSSFAPSSVNDKGVKRVDTATRLVHDQPLNIKYEKDVFDSVSDVLARYNKDIPNFFTGSQCFDTGYNHLLYKGSEGGKYVTHIDSFEKEPRLISISILLNDDFDGGNFCFYDEHIIEKKIGSAVVFPSNFCFPHSITPVSKGDRHSIITWIG